MLKKKQIVKKNSFYSLTDILLVKSFGVSVMSKNLDPFVFKPRLWKLGNLVQNRNFVKPKGLKLQINIKLK